MSTDIEEHATVRLTRDWVATVTFPQWFTGTVVHRHPGVGGAIVAYDVEFTDGEGRGVLVSVPVAYVEKVDPLSTKAFDRWNAGFSAPGDVTLTDTLGQKCTITLGQLLADLAMQGIACLPANVMQRLIREREPMQQRRPHCDDHDEFRADCEACQVVDGDFIIR